MTSFKHNCHSLFQEQMPNCRTVEPLRYVALKHWYFQCHPLKSGLVERRQALIGHQISTTRIIGVILHQLDDGYLSDDYRPVLKDLKKIVEAERTLGLKIKPTKCEIFSWGHH